MLVGGVAYYYCKPSFIWGRGSIKIYWLIDVVNEINGTDMKVYFS